jgi:hypothetical protein
MKSNVSDEHNAHTRGSMPRRFEPDSTVNDDSDSQPEKHSSHKISTEAGMDIYLNAQQSKSAFASIRRSFDPEANFNEARYSQYQK